MKINNKRDYATPVEEKCSPTFFKVGNMLHNSTWCGCCDRFRRNGKTLGKKYKKTLRNHR